MFKGTLTKLTDSLFTTSVDKERRVAQLKQERFELLRELKGAIREVVQFALTSDDEQSEKSVGSKELDEGDAVVKELCVVLERCLWHGLRDPTGSETVSSTFWDFVHVLGSINNPQGDTFRKIVRTVKQINELLFVKTNAGRARAWLRLALNEQVLDSSLAYLMRNDAVLQSSAQNTGEFAAASATIAQRLLGGTWLSQHYRSFALLRDQESSTIFISLLLGLNGLNFALHSDLEWFDTRPPPARRPMTFGATDRVRPINTNNRDEHAPVAREKHEVSKVQHEIAQVAKAANKSKSSWGFPSSIKSAVEESIGMMLPSTNSASVPSTSILGIPSTIRGSIAAETVATPHLNRNTSSITAAKASFEWQHQAAASRKRMLLRPRTFGSELSVLVRSPHTCAVAILEVQLGVPDIMARCVGYLWSAPSIHLPNVMSSMVEEHNNLSLLGGNTAAPKRNHAISTPARLEDTYHHNKVLALKNAFERLGPRGLWSLYHHNVDRDTACASIAALSTGALQHIESIKDSLEPHSIANLLKLFLRQLPNPLIPFSFYEAFIACQMITEPSEHLRNLQCLVDNLPDTHKPSLELLVALLARTTAPEQSAINGATVTKVARDMAPVILRPDLGSQTPDGSVSASVLGNVQEASQIVESMVNHHSIVFANVIAKSKKLAFRLHEKQQTLIVIAHESEERLNVSSTEHVELLQNLWNALGKAIETCDELVQVQSSELNQQQNTAGVGENLLRASNDEQDTSSTTDNNQSNSNSNDEQCQTSTTDNNQSNSESIDEQCQTSTVDTKQSNSDSNEQQCQTSAIYTKQPNSDSNEQQCQTSAIDTKQSNSATTDTKQSNSDCNEQHSKTQSMETGHTQFALESIGWKSRGSETGRIAKDLEIGSVNSVKDMVFFAQHYREAATSILSRHATATGPLSYHVLKAASELSKAAIDILGLGDLARVPLVDTYSQLDPKDRDSGARSNQEDRSNLTPFIQRTIAVQRLALQPWWKFLDTQDASRHVFCMLLMLFDSIWNTKTATLADFDRILRETTLIVSDYLATGPPTMDHLWALWIRDKCELGASAADDSRPEDQNVMATSWKDMLPKSAERITTLAHQLQETWSQLPQVVSPTSHKTTGTSPSATDLDHNEIVADGNTVPANAESTQLEESEKQDVTTISNDQVLHSYLPTLMSPSDIITPNMVVKLEGELPTSYQGYDWQLVYNSTQHGSDLDRLLKRGQTTAVGLLLVKDVTGNVFGVFCPFPLRQHSEYYGSGESFLFTFTPHFKAFKWTEKNPYYMLANEDALAVGGGNGFGLYLDADLKAGTSATCQTYDNDVLCGDDCDGEFRCEVVEYWGFVFKNLS